MADRHHGKRKGGNNGGKKKGSSGSSRPVPVDSAEQRLIELIVKLGDGTNDVTLDRHLLDLAGTLGDPARHPVVIDTVFKCIVALPYKTSIYATLMALLLGDIGISSSSSNSSASQLDSNKEGNGEHSTAEKSTPTASLERDEAVLSFVKRLSQELHKAMRNCDYYAIKFLLRFVSELVNCNVISNEQATSLFTRILDILIAAMEIPQHLLDFYLTCVISALIFNTKSQATESNCLERLKQLMKHRKSTSWMSVFDPSKVLAPDVPQVAQVQFTPDDSIEHLFHNYRTWVETQDKALRVALRPFELPGTQSKLSNTPSGSSDARPPLLRDAFDWFDPLVSSASDVADLVTMKTYIDSQNSILSDLGLEPLTYPKDLTSCHFSNPKPMCYIFPEAITSGGGAAAMSPLDRWFTEDYALDIIHFFRSTHAEILKQLYFCKRMDLQDAHLCEIILKDLLRMPASPYPPVHHGVLLLDLVQKSPSFNAILVDAANRLFGSIPALHPTAITSFVDWFSYHLSNSDFHWNWLEWSQLIPKSEMEAERDGQALPPTSQAHTSFIRDVLSRMIRLSYYDRIAPMITSAVPTHAAQWLPPKPDPLPPSDAFYMSPLALSIHEEIKNRHKPADSVFTPILACGMAVPLTSEQVLKVVSRALFSEGSSSITLLQTTLTKYHQVLHKLAYGVQTNLETPREGGKQILLAALEFYSQSPQHFVIAVLELLHQKLVEPPIVISFILDPEIVAQHGRKSFLWETIDHTIRFVLQSKFVLQTEVVNAWKLACRSEPDADPVELARHTKVKKESSLVRLEELKAQVQPIILALFTSLIDLLANPSHKDLVLGHFETLAIKFKSNLLQVVPALSGLVSALPADAQASFERIKSFSENF